MDVEGEEIEAEDKRLQSNNPFYYEKTGLQKFQIAQAK